MLPELNEKEARERIAGRIAADHLTDEPDGHPDDEPDGLGLGDGSDPEPHGRRGDGEHPGVGVRTHDAHRLRDRRQLLVRVHDVQGTRRHAEHRRRVARGPRLHVRGDKQRRGGRLGLVLDAVLTRAAPAHEPPHRGSTFLPFALM